MGADQSNSNIDQKLENEIYDFANGNFAKNSLRYIFFLMNANNYFKYDQFFIKLDIRQIADYIDDLGVINIQEAKTIVQQIINTSNCDEVATLNLQIILPKMRIIYNDKFISPVFSKDLFKQIISNTYDTKWGKYTPNSIVDWNLPDIEENFSIQSQDKLNQIFENKPKLTFLTKENDESNVISFPVLHSEDISSLIMKNHVDKLIQMNNNALQGIKFYKKISKPMKWRINIHEAAFHGDEQSVTYCLHLLPVLLNCPDDKGNTPAHLASFGNNPNMIKLLFSFGADFTIVNEDGNMPLHISGGKKVVLVFKSLGFDLNERNQKGETLFEIKTRDFNMEVIEALLELKVVNILLPNSKGVYWMQYVIHDEFYKQQMTFVKFQKKIRSIIRSHYEINQLIKGILNRNANKCDVEDTIDMNHSVDEKNVERVKVLLALGAHADRIRENGKTNLMLCAERNDSEIAEILASNFCDPNFKNERGENTFWVSAYLNNIDTALAVRDHGANMNDLSLSGDTILHVAYKDKNTELFDFLLSAYCSPNTKNRNNESVLFQAFCARDDQIAELIQDKYEGDINTTGQDGNSLAHVALLENDFKRIDYYIERGIDIEIKNKYGQTIFMISITMFDDLELCKHLLTNGSDINTQDINGNTALLNILHSKKFDKSKFDFLINNNCDINIQNSLG